jgi:hypothetical protein
VKIKKVDVYISYLDGALDHFEVVPQYSVGDLVSILKHELENGKFASFYTTDGDHLLISTEALRGAKILVSPNSEES